VDRSEQLARARVRKLGTGIQKRLNKLNANLLRDANRAADGERLVQLGHLLKGNLYQARKGMKNLSVPDFEGMETVIPLNPRLSPVENMEQLYRKAKRFKRAKPLVGERLEGVEAKSRMMDSFLAEIDRVDLDQLDALEKEIRRRFPSFAQKGPRGGKREGERRPYREYTIASGRPARVGRSAKDNDELTLRHAGPEDLWLHVRGRSGSHVVVPMGRGEDPSPAILVDAAHLAAHFSEARNDGDVEVIYTRRRYVQKPRGAAPGSVRLLKERTLNLRLETHRLKKLLTNDPALVDVTDKSTR
jgi:predicted ribosome quality control (RQC) complex YloA/Tae2 family protein